MPGATGGPWSTDRAEIERSDCSDYATQQTLDQATNDVASASADVAEAEANHDAAVAGPTKEERAIADTQVAAAAAVLAVLERRMEKTILRAPADGGTLLMGSDALVTLSHFRKTSYDPLTDLLPICNLASTPTVSRQIAGTASNAGSKKRTGQMTAFPARRMPAAARKPARPLRVPHAGSMGDWAVARAAGASAGRRGRTPED